MLDDITAAHGGGADRVGQLTRDLKRGGRGEFAAQNGHMACDLRDREPRATQDGAER
jgi:hypothetical protein